MAGNVLSIYFNDFKKVIGNHRLYYYEGENYVDLQFIAEGHIVKTTVLKSDIDNIEKFFGDPIFYNSIRLAFRIPDVKQAPFEIDGARQPVDAPESIVTDNAPVELENEDIQQEGVE